MKKTLKVTFAALAGVACLTAGPAVANHDGYYGHDQYRRSDAAPYYDPWYLTPERRSHTYDEREQRRRDREARRYREWRDGQWYERGVPLEAELANRDQDYLNQGRDGRGWSHDGSHSGG